MKNILYVAVAMLILASCEKPKKIAFVDNGTVINGLQEKIDLESNFKIKEDSFRKKFDSIDSAFKLEVQTFQESSKKMSNKKAQQKYQELGQKQQYIDQQKQVEAQQFQQSFQVELDSIISKVKSFEKSYGKNNDYSYILGTTDATSSVLYGSDENDITQTVLDSLNAKYEASKTK